MIREGIKAIREITDFWLHKNCKKAHEFIRGMNCELEGSIRVFEFFIYYFYIINI